MPDWELKTTALLSDRRSWLDRMRLTWLVWTGPIHLVKLRYHNQRRTFVGVYWR